MKNDFNTVHYLIALLKAYGLKNIISSPGTQNSFFNATVQEDKDFQCFSVIDERSAAYVATGISFETQAPTVITCTGATAARNYMSALTEAYYRRIPIIAITFFDTSCNKYNLSPQYTDRSVSQNDIKYLSIELPTIHNQKDKINCITFINAALSQAFYLNKPVHINCPACIDFSCFGKGLPTDIWKVNYYAEDFEDISSELENKDFAVFIGSHDRFTQEEENAISQFAESWNIPIFCDHTSQYQGKNKVLISKAFSMVRNLSNKPKIIIDIGHISGDYNYGILFSAAKIWRVQKDGQYQARGSRPVTKIFDCSEKLFFTSLVNKKYKTSDYYTKISQSIKDIKYPELPLSTALICKNLVQHLPKNSSLHLAILNSLRNMNFFDIDSSISVNCNVGGFGIDGAISSIIGQSLARPDKKCFGVVGDLAFFYDMNILGQRDIKNNIRIIMINNNKGMEMRLNPILEKFVNEKSDLLITACGHNKCGAKGWAESCGFKYFSADTKESFLNQIEAFCNGTFEQPLLFEVFTKTKDEQNAVKLIKNFNRNKIEEGLINCYKMITK